MADRVVRFVLVGDSKSAVRAMRETATAADTTAAKMAKLEKAGRGMEKAGKAMVMMGAPVLALGAYSVKASADFGKSMAQIQATTGVSNSEIDRLGRSVKAMAGDVGTSANELSAGAYHIESVGLRGKRASDALKIAAEGAKIGTADLEDTTNALGAAIVSGIGGVQDYRRAMGALLGIVGSGDMRMQDLADAFGTGLLAPMRRFGVRLQDVGGALAVFGDNNIRGAEAGTKLASTIRIMAAPSNAAARALGAINLTQTQLADDIRRRGLVAAFVDLKRHLDELGGSKSERSLILTRAFGGRQSMGVQTLLNRVGWLKRKTDEVTASTGRFDRAWKTTQQTVAFRAESAVAKIGSAIIDLGDALSPIAAAVLPKFGAVLSRTVKILAGAPEPVRDVVLALSAFMVIGGTALIFLGKLAVAFKELKVATIASAVASKAWAAAQWLVNAAMDANPIMLVITGLVALAAGIVYAYEHWRTFRRVVDNVFGWIKGAAGTVVSFFKKHWKLLAVIVSGPLAPLVALLTHLRQVKSVVKDIISLPGKGFNAVKSLASKVNPFHHAGGGLISGYATGGLIPQGFALGGPVGTDTVPAWLTPGEFVVRREVVQAVGAPALAQLNSGPSAAMAVPSSLTVSSPVYLDGRAITEVITRHVLRAGART